ncbi:MAG: nucleotide exchange factor GrpE [Acidimicrobiales bacterium]
MPGHRPSGASRRGDQGGGPPTRADQGQGDPSTGEEGLGTPGPEAPGPPPTAEDPEPRAEQPTASAAAPGETDDDVAAGEVVDDGEGVSEAVLEEVEAVAEQVEVSIDDVLTTANAERDEFRDHLLRLQADFDNYRKRVQKELGEAGDKALGHFVDELLPVLDAVDAARAHGVAEVEQVAGLLVDLLSKQGLERVGADGDVFDPMLHDAVLHEAGDDDVQSVAQVLRAGWRWRGKVLRPAMVKVVGG